MNELKLIKKCYEDFEVVLQDEGIKRVLWSVWNQVSETKSDALFAKNGVLEYEEKFNTIEKRQNKQDEKIEKNADFAECLYNNSSAMKEWRNHVNSLAYRMTGGSSEIKDQLFHGILTKNCKSNVCNELNATCEGRIKVSDMELAKKAAIKYLTPFEANRIIHETVRRWQSQIAKGSVRKTLDIDMLNKYIEQENEKAIKNMEDKLNEIQ